MNSSNISFQQFGESITSQQASSVKEYNKIYSLPDGTLKKIETIRNGEIKTINYYRDDNETELQALEILVPYNCGFTILVQEKYGTYVINYGNIYYEGLIVGKFREVKERDRDFTCYQDIYLIDNQLIIESTVKYIGAYRGDENEGEPISNYYCRFHYNTDGSLDYCEFNYMSDYDSEIFHQDDIGLIREKFILSDEMYNYYLTAEFLPPH